MNTNIKIIPLNEGYLCFDSFTDTDKAKAVFTQRFGVEPKEVRWEPQNRNWWVGPVPDDEDS